MQQNMLLQFPFTSFILILLCNATDTILLNKFTNQQYRQTCIYLRLPLFKMNSRNCGI